jgi:hypothetical protein
VRRSAGVRIPKKGRGTRPAGRAGGLAGVPAIGLPTANLATGEIVHNPTPVMRIP